MEDDNSKSKQTIFILSDFLIGIILGVGGMLLYNSLSPKPISQPIVKNIQSADRAQITAAVTATKIDKDGKAVNPADTFNATSDNSIYVVGTLKNVPKGSKVEYVRYLNGKYLDSKVATISKDGKKYFSFAWITKSANNTHPDGVYTVKLYLNGDVNEAVTYVIK